MGINSFIYIWEILEDRPSFVEKVDCFISIITAEHRLETVSTLHSLALSSEPTLQSQQFALAVILLPPPLSLLHFSLFLSLTSANPFKKNTRSRENKVYPPHRKRYVEFCGLCTVLRSCYLNLWTLSFKPVSGASFRTCTTSSVPEHFCWFCPYFGLMHFDLLLIWTETRSIGVVVL